MPWRLIYSYAHIHEGFSVKSLLIKTFHLLILILILPSTDLFAIELSRDTFTGIGNTNSWSGKNTTQENNQLRINRDTTASKTFNFPTYANKPVLVKLTATKIDMWELDDLLEINFNGTLYKSNTTGTISLNGTVNASGKLTITIKPNTSKDAEDIYIDDVIITTIDNIAPVVANATFSISDKTSNGTGVGTVTATDANGDSISYSIISGNTGNTFTINSANGLITVATSSNLNHTATPSYSLTVQASDGSLSSNGTININITAPIPVVNVGERTFALRNPVTTRNIKGGLKVIGNTVLCVKSGGVCYDYSGELSNSQLDLQYIDVDGVNRTYNNSSQAELSIPSTATVKWVGVYTQGYISNNNSSEVGDIVKEAMYLTVPSVGTLSVIPEIVDLYNNNNYGYTYDTYSSIPSLVGKKGFDINGWITGANIKAETGEDSSSGLGNFGAWTLVVVYEDTNASLKNISVFDGYKQVANIDGFKSVDITTAGFLTPTSGIVTSTVSLFVGEGDKNIIGDKLYVDGVAINETNAFYSITSGFNAKPNYANKQGIDIQNHQVGVDGNTSHPQIIGRNKQSATITLTSVKDTYFPSMVAFTTDLYEPRVCYAESYFDSSGNPLKNPNIGDTVIIKTWIANMKKDASDGNLDVAQKVEITMEVDNKNLHYKSNTLSIKNIGESANSNKTDTKDSDIAEFSSDINTSVWRIGTGAGAINGGDLQPNITNDPANKVYVSFQTELLTSGNINLANLYKVSYENSNMGLRIGDESPVNIGICADFNTSLVINAPLGIFNIVNDNFSGGSISDNPKDEENALFTQVVNQNFNVKILALNTDFVTLKPYTGDLNLSLISTPNYLITDTEMQKQEKCNSASSLTSFQTITFSNQSVKELTLNYPTAYTNISFKMSFNDNGILKYVCSRDSFSIRPITYALTANTAPLIGGNTNYTLTIDALASGYNQSITANTIDKNASIDLNIPIGCTLPASKIEVTPPINFSDNGVASYSPFVYNNVGDVNVTISDNDWTKIDQQSFNGKLNDDCIVGSTSSTPINGKVGCLIQKVQSFVFIPKEFKNNLDVQNFNDGNFTYISNDGNMSATALLTTKAILENNATATNYTANCFAKDINYTLSLKQNPTTWLNGIPDAINRIRYFDDDNVTSHFENNNTIGSAIFSSFEGNFTNGIAPNLAMRFNIVRAINKLDEPFHIAKNDFNITAMTDTSGTIGVDFNRTVDKNTTFYYGRVYARNHTVNGNFANNVPIYYEVYCKTCNRQSLDINGSESVDSLNWYKNLFHATTHAELLDANYTAISGTTPNGHQALSIDLTAPKVPHKDKIQMHAPSWLLHDPISSMATTNDFLVEFTQGATTWAGQGSLGRTIDDTNTSVSRKSNKRIEW